MELNDNSNTKKDKELYYNDGSGLSEIDEYEDYQTDEELEDYLYINNKINSIYSYIKNISKSTMYPLFDKLSINSLFEFLYSDIDIDEKFLF